MMATTSNRPEETEATVVVVDDEPDVADVYALQLRTRYDDVRTAYGGEEALEAVDGDVDVVLLDRRMPVPGDDVLDAIRDRGLPCRVVMVTAVDPDVDILDMDFDDYLCKPIDKDDLLSAVDGQLTARTYDEGMEAFLRLASKLAVLEAEKTPEQLEGSEEYARIKRRAAELRARLDAARDGFDDAVDAFRAIDRNG